MGRSLIRVFFCLFEQLVEFLAEDVLSILLVSEGFVEFLIAPGSFFLKTGDGGGDVVDGGGLFFGLVANDGAGSRVDFEGSVAAGAGDFEEWGTVRHRAMLQHPKALIGGDGLSNFLGLSKVFRRLNATGETSNVKHEG